MMVFDTAVVHEPGSFAHIRVRMGVGFSGRTMGSPSCMCDADSTRNNLGNLTRQSYQSAPPPLPPHTPGQIFPRNYGLGIRVCVVPGARSVLLCDSPRTQKFRTLLSIFIC